MNLWRRVPNRREVLMSGGLTISMTQAARVAVTTAVHMSTAVRTSIAVKSIAVVGEEAGSPDGTMLMIIPR